ncbi:hypothetical protein BCR44DRAFT_43671 [Catenaria anguillulae PL171]|uniref:Transmembrane protein 230 n=1 Tax=Catenaria anguillulae PL171 TaxID=765915 RepID=A0A1Y2HDT9_9FUNG|nr:hypothetical protein BCR44DRAFT_43671 [Catenaria anguillulae PL171]
MSSIPSSPPSPAQPPRATSPNRRAKLEPTGNLMPRLDSATSTSTATLPPVSSNLPTPAAPAPVSKPDSTTTSRQRRTVRIAPPASAHVSSGTDKDNQEEQEDDERVDDFATERDRLLANHGVSDTTPLLGSVDNVPSTSDLSTERVAAHRLARRQGMRTSGRTSLRTEYHTPLPWRALTLTVFLFSFGSIALSTSLYLFLGYGHAKDPDKWQPLAVLGTLCMIPGGFYLWHFLMVALGVPGWTYDDIPEL